MSVATVLSILNVTVLFVTADVNPVPPVNVKVSVPISTLSGVDPSEISKITEPPPDTVAYSKPVPPVLILKNCPAEPPDLLIDERATD